MKIGTRSTGSRARAAWTRSLEVIEDYSANNQLHYSLLGVRYSIFSGTLRWKVYLCEYPISINEYRMKKLVAPRSTYHCPQIFRRRNWWYSASGIQDKPGCVSKDGQEFPRFLFDKLRRSESQYAAWINVPDEDRTIPHFVVSKLRACAVIELQAVGSALKHRIDDRFRVAADVKEIRQ